MRRMTLGDMLTELRNEARISTTAAHGAHLRDRYASLLRRVQEEVWTGYEWPDLDASVRVAIAQAQRYVQCPDLLDPDSVRSVNIRWPTRSGFSELTWGIGVEQYSEHDFELDAATGTTTRIDRYLSPLDEDLSGRQFELWPVPEGPCTLLFEGKRALLPLIQDSDTSTVDGMVIVLHAAAELLAAQKAEDAGLKLQKAQSRYDGLRAAQARKDNRRHRLSSGPTVAPRGQRFRHE